MNVCMSIFPCVWSKMAKGKVKMDKVQRNTRKLAGAMAEYVRLEAYTLTSVTVFFKKCRNNKKHKNMYKTRTKNNFITSKTFFTILFYCF